MDVTTCGRADLQELDVENPAALRTEDSTSTLPLRFARGAAQSDSNGNEVVTSTVRFYPYGEYRVTPTSDLTDKGFTGHAQNDEVALIYMRARYYVPGVGRFASADTIVPDPTAPQSLNRYSYVRNNPVKLFDPTGHAADAWGVTSPTSCRGGASLEQCSYPANYPDTSKVGYLIPMPTLTAPDSRLRRIDIGTNDTDCTDSLAECFAGRDVKDFSQEPNISQNEFTELLDSVAEDIYKNWTPGGLVPGGLAGRDRYDTPFYNNGGTYPSGQEVCIGDMGCWGRSEINYFAQGMWSASAGDSVEEALATTQDWNQTFYEHDATEGELYWTEFGYDYYLTWLARNP